MHVEAIGKQATPPGSTPAPSVHALHVDHCSLGPWHSREPPSRKLSGVGNVCDLSCMSHAMS